MKKYFLYVIMFIAITLLGVFLPSVTFSKDAILNGLIIDVSTESLLCILVVVFGLSFYKNKLKFNKIKLNTALWLIPECLVVIANFPFHAIITGQARVTSYSYLPLFILNCILIGVCEELLFRIFVNSYVKEKVINSRNGYIKYAVISSMIFGLCHLFNLLAGANLFDTLLQVGYSFLIGAMLTAVYEKTNCIWASVILHTLFDFGGKIITAIGSGRFQDEVFWVLTCVFGLICAIHVTVYYIKTNKEFNKSVSKR